MIVATKELTQDAHETALDKLSQYVGGADPCSFPMFSELYGGEDFGFAALKPEVTKAEDLPTILKRTYGAALYRDAVYAHLNRGQLLALAANNEFRMHYEAGRIAILSGISGEEATA